VGNPKAYAVQYPDGSYTPVRSPLTYAVLKAHLDKETTVGTYILKGDLARTLVFDFDTPLIEDLAPLHIALKNLGIPTQSIGVEFSGKKGHHMWVVLAQYVRAADLRRLGRTALGLAGNPECELNPKQDKAEDLGSLVKLPCGVHQVTGKENYWVSPVPKPLPVSVFIEILEGLPDDWGNAPRGNGGPPPVYECMENIQSKTDLEGARNKSLFHYAVMLRRGGVSPEYVEWLIRQVNAELDSPLGFREIETLLKSSENSGPICSQLPNGIRCEDCPILNRGKLYTRPGQLRHAAEGESVVVKVAGRRQRDVVELDHPDLQASGLGKLKEKK
jgi:hypothetical protein